MSTPILSTALVPCFGTPRSISFRWRQPHGYRVNLVRFPWVEIKSHLGAAEAPDDLLEFLDSIRVTPLGVQQHAVKIKDGGIGSGPAMYTPLEDRIYVNYPALGGLCSWQGDRFAPATPEERQRLDGIRHLTNQDIEHGPNGWSKRSFSVGPDDASGSFTVDAGKNFRISVNSQPNDTSDRNLSIYLLRPGHTRERIWNVNLHWGRVSKSEYEHVFEGRR
jgi:hypothetical protein